MKKVEVKVIKFETPATNNGELLVPTSKLQKLDADLEELIREEFGIEKSIPVEIVGGSTEYRYEDFNGDMGFDI